MPHLYNWVYLHGKILLAAAVAFRLHPVVRQIASSVPGRKDFLSNPVHMFDQSHLRSRSCSRNCCHQPGSPSSYNSNCSVFHLFCFTPDCNRGGRFRPLKHFLLTCIRFQIMVYIHHRGKPDSLHQPRSLPFRKISDRNMGIQTDSAFIAAEYQ